MNGLSKAHPRNVIFLLVAFGVLASAAHGAPASLINGVPVTGLSGTIGSEMSYAIVVPAGQDDLEISISGGTGDCDLYVRKDSPPTTTSYDYRPYKVGSNESVAVASPAAGTWYIMLKGYTAYSGLTLVATYSATVTVVPLTNGVAVTGLSAPTGSELLFKIDVPAGQSKLQIATSGGTGDCDLYVKRGALPTTSDYDYRPFLLGNDETATVNNPNSGTWYIMLKAYNAYAGLTLLASYGGGVGTVLQNGVPVTGIAGTQTSEKVYRIDVPAGQTNLEIVMSGGTGDADLYVKRGARPTTADYDYRPFLAGSDESVSVNSPAAGTWYIMIRGYSDYSGLTLKASYGDVFILQDEVPITSLSGGLGTERVYKMDVPPGQSEFEIKISGGTGNADLYVKRGSRPTISNWDYRPYLSGNNETVSISNPQTGTWYIMIRARQAYTGLTVLGDYWFSGSVTLLTNGIPVSGITGTEGSEKYFRIIVPSGQAKLEIEISGGTGDADLYVKRDSPPTTSSYDYRPYQIGNNEKVTVDNPTGGNWLIMVRGYHAYSGLTIVATHGGGGGGGGGGTVTTLANGVPETGLSGGAGSETFYKIDIPAGQAKLDIEIFGGTGDVDMYVRKDARPTQAEWDYRPYLIGNNEKVTINNPAAGSYFIMLRAYQTYSGVTLQATYVPVAQSVTTLGNGVPVPGLSATAGSEDFYKIDVPAGQDSLSIEISGGTGDCDLYVKRGSKPTTSSWDYRPYLIGNNEKVDVVNPTATTWFIMLKAYQTYSGMTLVATYGTSKTGNNFSADPAAVALWRFEPGALTADSLGGNTLVPQFSPDVNTVDFKEGAASGNIKTGHFLIGDAALDVDFPLKSGDTEKNISVAFWMNAAYGEPITTGRIMYGKGGVFGQQSFAVGFYEAAGPGTGRIALNIGILGGTNHETFLNPTKVIESGQWYHVAVSYEHQTTFGNVRIRIYDPSDDTVEEMVASTSNPIFVSDGNLAIGAYRYSAQEYVGLLDEMVVFNDILTPTEIDKIRQGTYGKP